MDLRGLSLTPHPGVLNRGSATPSALAGPWGAGRRRSPAGGRGDPWAQGRGQSGGPRGEGRAAQLSSPRTPRSAEIGASRGDSKLQAFRLEPGLEFSKSEREKDKPAPYPLRHLLPELEYFSWQMSFGRHGPEFHPWLPDSRVGSPARRLGVRQDRDPSPGNTVSGGRPAAALGRDPSGSEKRRAVAGPTPREEGSTRGPGDPMFSDGKAGAPRGEDADFGQPPSRSGKGADPRGMIRGGNAFGRTRNRGKRWPPRPGGSRHFPGGAAASVGTARGREKLAPGGPRLPACRGGRETRGPSDLPLAAAGDKSLLPGLPPASVPGVPRLQKKKTTTTKRLRRESKNISSTRFL